LAGPLGQIAELGEVGAAGPLAAKPSRQSLEHLADFISLKELARAEFTDKHAQVVDDFHQSTELQFQQTLADDGLRDAEVLGQSKLGEPAAWGIRAAEDGLLNAIPHAASGGDLFLQGYRGHLGNWLLDYRS
jgi:hypothetical protein